MSAPALEHSLRLIYTLCEPCAAEDRLDTIQPALNRKDSP